jgi:hypothetical protein
VVRSSVKKTSHLYDTLQSAVRVKSEEPRMSISRSEDPKVSNITQRSMYRMLIPNLPLLINTVLISWYIGCH